MSSEFLKNEGCPNCIRMGKDRSRNNLGVWTDHVRCWSCGYYKSNNPLQMRDINNKKKDTRYGSGIRLSTDCIDILPERCVEWLDQYDLNDNEIDGKFLWSEQFQQLIYPIYDDNKNLVFYQGRSFHQDGEKHTKYHTQGLANKIYHMFGPESCAIIVVEDLISAIKVGRQFRCMPLWGSEIGPERVRMLSERFCELWIWLDKDKAGFSMKARLQALPYFDLVKSVITEKDPKEYNNDQIKGILI